MEIILMPKDCEDAIKFGEDIVRTKNQSQKDFGSEAGRGYDDNFVDIVEGKLSEVIFNKFMKDKFMLEGVVDYAIYPGQLAIDFGQDFDKVKFNGNDFINRSKVDVKATRAYSLWLLVEGHKFWSDAYVLIKIDLPRDSEKSAETLKATLIKDGAKGRVCGFAYYFDLVDLETKEPVVLFKAGEKLFHPKILNDVLWKRKNVTEHLAINKNKIEYLFVTLKASRNFGIPISKLRSSVSDWDSFGLWIKSSLIPI